MPSNIVNDVITSQGNSPIAGATKFSIKRARGSASSASKLDASTLALPHGSTRVYESGVPDAGPAPSDDGISITATIDGLGTPPAAGSTLTVGGVLLKCADVTTDNNVGELVSWSASYVQPPSEE